MEPLPNAPLHLYEEVLLLALDDERGTTSWTVDAWHALAGAVLAELILAGRARIEGPEDGRRLVPRAPRGEGASVPLDPLLARWWSRIADELVPRNPTEWTAELAAQPHLRDEAAQGLVQRGVLHVERDRLLRLFPRTRYPEDDRTAEDEVLARLRTTLFTDERDVSERTCALLALARATGLLNEHFGRGEVRRAGARLDALLAASPIARDVAALVP